MPNHPSTSGQNNGSNTNNQAIIDTKTIIADNRKKIYRAILRKTKEESIARLQDLREFKSSFGAAKIAWNKAIEHKNLQILWDYNFAIQQIEAGKIFSPRIKNNRVYMLNQSAALKE